MRVCLSSKSLFPPVVGAFTADAAPQDTWSSRLRALHTHSKSHSGKRLRSVLGCRTPVHHTRLSTREHIVCLVHCCHIHRATWYRRPRNQRRVMVRWSRRSAQQKPPNLAMVCSVARVEPLPYCSRCPRPTWAPCEGTRGAAGRMIMLGV